MQPPQIPEADNQYDKHVQKGPIEDEVGQQTSAVFSNRLRVYDWSAHWTTFYLQNDNFVNKLINLTDLI